MHFFDTGDRVVDVCLQKLDGYSTWREDSDAETTHKLLIGLIHVKEMLPAAVAKHFDFPFLYVGNAHFVGSQEYRRKLIGEITRSISAGLAKVEADPKLKRQKNADFSDRPRSRGEEILDALDFFQKDRSTAAFSKLKMAAACTNLQSRLKEIEKLLTRKRPIGNQSPSLAIEGHLNRLALEAEAYHDRKI